MKQSVNKLLMNLESIPCLSSKHLDTEYVESLSPDIFRAHVNNTFHTEFGANGGSRDPMLPRTSLSDDTSLAETTR